MQRKDIKTFEELKQYKAKFYGKNGEIKVLQNKIREATNEEKKTIGQKITELKKEAEAFFILKTKEIEKEIIEKKISEEWIDVTLPINEKGSLHPLTIISNRFRTWLIQHGFFETTGMEIETDEYNFERLNIPKEHPAREMQDSLYINSSLLLRTHNTGFTARELEKYKDSSFAHFTIGKVYRNDEDDQTHSHQFMQVDLVAVGFYNFKNLIWTLKSLMSYVLEEEVDIRLRPSYFPFTEPSVEVDILYKGKWIEVLGAGMLHPSVLKAAGYSDKIIDGANGFNGIAAGIGIERIAMIKYGINDIREFYRNDQRFLDQFKEVA